ncbi:hypothetical protein H4684_003576 [Desulfomicrobium macestii]|uniref:Uncharacterized protein n=2 Tax=Desulfomicrobium TaxID=898 RepID=A0A8G2C5D2_DESNO|nr:hypothetical protein [Desulfomicrobium macestii]MBE1426894.1 hypothetical protein [Desulfomicrobium macestii]SFM00194.1 hypothetical protein SAMN05421830_11140 [Desulfomicrobium norvegicum]
MIMQQECCFDMRYRPIVTSRTGERSFCYGLIEKIDENHHFSARDRDGNQSDASKEYLETQLR